jgi:uncharacterized membrane protein
MHNGWQLGFLADAFNDDQVAVFMPGAPDPSSGVVQIVSTDHITQLDISTETHSRASSSPGAGFQTFWGSS